MCMTWAQALKRAWLAHKTQRQQPSTTFFFRCSQGSHCLCLPGMMRALSAQGCASDVALGLALHQPYLYLLQTQALTLTSGFVTRAKMTEQRPESSDPATHGCCLRNPCSTSALFTRLTPPRIQAMACSPHRCLLPCEVARATHASL